MFWIGFTSLMLLASLIFAFLEWKKQVISTDSCLPVSFIIMTVILMASCLALLDFGPGLKVKYDKYAYEKEWIEQSAVGLKYQYRGEVSKFVESAKDFNIKLSHEQAVIREWGNFWNFHNGEILNIAPIDIKKVLEESGVSEYNNINFKTSEN